MHDHTTEIKLALRDPVQLCAKLGLTEHSKRQSTGLLICCPAHGDKSPSCSVTLGPDGLVRIKCFACDFAGDALALIAEVYGLPTSGPGFLDVIRAGAELAGLNSVLAALSDPAGTQTPPADQKPKLDPVSAQQYPETVELVELWETAISVADDPKVSGYLVSRLLDPDAIAVQHLAKAIGDGTKIPTWGSYQNRSWRHTGHILIVPVWSPSGAMCSVRACLVLQSDAPKRLPPAGRKASGLVLANHRAVSILRGTDKQPQRIVFVEGEPDFLTLATHCELPIFGVLSGAWTQEHANKIPKGSDVIIMTHADDAGDRYAQQIAGTLRNKCAVWRRLP